MNNNQENNSKITYKRGVFVLVEKLPSGDDDYVVFSFSGKIRKLGMPSNSYDLAIFNELMFANWFPTVLPVTMNNINGEFIIRDHFLILQILDQKRWDFVMNKLAIKGVTTAVLNPCEGSKDHQCPTYRFNLEDKKDFNKLQKWFSRCPNTHYDLEVNYIYP